jgi:hypothetical protein
MLLGRLRQWSICSQWPLLTRSNGVFANFYPPCLNRAGLASTVQINLNDDSEKLAKAIAKVGRCSRREAEKLILDVRISDEE